MNFIAHRIVMPARKVRRLVQHACLHFDNSRYANADSCQFACAALLRNNLLDGDAHFVDYLIASARDLRAGSDFV